MSNCSVGFETELYSLKMFVLWRTLQKCIVDLSSWSLRLWTVLSSAAHPTHTPRAPSHSLSPTWSALPQSCLLHKADRPRWFTRSRLFRLNHLPRCIWTKPLSSLQVHSAGLLCSHCLASMFWFQMKRVSMRKYNFFFFFCIGTLEDQSVGFAGHAERCIHWKKNIVFIVLKQGTFTLQAKWF